MLQQQEKTKDNMKKRLDLHLHTTASDGTWDIDTLLEKLREKGIGIFAVTDHDELGSTRALWEKRHTIPETFVPGVEVSVTHEGQEYHLTTYAFDPAEGGVAAVVEENRRRREAFNINLIRYIAEQCEEVSPEDYEAYTHERKRGGWKALMYLMDRGAIADMREFFMTVMRRGVRMEFLSPGEVIPRLHEAGARVMLAHPSVYHRGRMDETELDNWAEKGIDGFECYSSQIRPKDSRYYVDYCDRKGLMITGGSDCHGDFVNRPLGEPRVTRDDIRVDFL